MVTALLWLSIPNASLFVLGQQDDAAERLYFNAQTFMVAGKYQEALTDLENVVKMFPSSPFASQALLDVGRYYLEVTGEDSKAEEFFGRTLNDYPNSAEAPAAYYFQAVIAEKNGSSPEELERAIANLIRMENLFPNNAWRNGALFLFGKLSMRLGQYDQALTYFQRLEFNYPQSEFLPQALLLSAQVAYYNGFRAEAERILARLQAQVPNAKEATTASLLLRLLSRFQDTSPVYELDRGFFASTPKAFQNPSGIGIGWDGMLAVKDGRGVLYATLAGENQKRLDVKDIEGFCRDRSGRLRLVFENRIGSPSGDLLFSNLSGADGPLRSLKSAAIDGFGRLFALDGNTRDVRAYLANGKPTQNFAISKPDLVRAFENRVWVLNSDGNSFTQIGPTLATEVFQLRGVQNIEDFCFDALGHIYVLHDKGNQISAFDRQLVQKFNQNLKTGSWPMKSAEALAVDASGALYLADKKSGSVYRFQ